MSTPEERLRSFYEQRATEYPDTEPEAVVRFRKALRAAELLPGERLLDIGAKRGGLGQCASAMGLDVEYTGLDLGQENVRRAVDLGLDVRWADSSDSLPIGDHEYDCVVCLELLEHLAVPVRLLHEIRRVVRQKGRVVLSVPNPYSWIEIYRELFRRPDTAGHLNSFTTPVMENPLALVGLRIDRRLGTSVRVPKTLLLLSTNSIMARSRIYVARPAERVLFAGREL